MNKPITLKRGSDQLPLLQDDELKIEGADGHFHLNIWLNRKQYPV